MCGMHPYGGNEDGVDLGTCVAVVGRRSPR